MYCLFALIIVINIELIPIMAHATSIYLCALRWNRDRFISTSLKCYHKILTIKQYYCVCFFFFKMYKYNKYYFYCLLFVVIETIIRLPSRYFRYHIGVIPVSVYLKSDNWNLYTNNKDSITYKRSFPTVWKKSSLFSSSADYLQIGVKIKKKNFVSTCLDEQRNWALIKFYFIVLNERFLRLHLFAPMY